MNSRHHISTISLALFCACIMSLGSLGCRQEASTTAQAESAPPSPAISFAEVVEIFKDGIDVAGGSASGFVAQSTGASTRFQVHNTVTSQLIPPPKPEDPYRGTITVSSQSIYSLRQVPKDEDDKNKSGSSDPNAKGPNDFENAAAAGSEIESFDPGLVAGPSSEKQPEGEDTPVVQRRPDKVDRVYELIYKGGRWELLTKLDHETEAAIENAFERALRLQP
jgi:hypothetical protein